MAKAAFDSPEVSTSRRSNGKLLVTLSVHGVDESNTPASVIDTAQGGINNAMRNIQLMLFVGDLARFVESGRKRNLGELVVTIQTATFSKGKIDDWVDTYRLRLPEERFDDFLKVTEISITEQVGYAERTWLIEMDKFAQFTYQK